MKITICSISSKEDDDDVLAHARWRDNKERETSIRTRIDLLASFQYITKTTWSQSKDPILTSNLNLRTHLLDVSTYETTLTLTLPLALTLTLILTLSHYLFQPNPTSIKLLPKISGKKNVTMASVTKNVSRVGDILATFAVFICDWIFVYRSARVVFKAICSITWLWSIL